MRRSTTTDFGDYGYYGSDCWSTEHVGSRSRRVFGCASDTRDLAKKEPRAARHAARRFSAPKTIAKAGSSAP